MAVPVGVVVARPVAVLVHPVVPDLGGPGVDRRVVVVAVVAAVLDAVVAVAVVVEFQRPVAVRVDAVPGGVGGAGVDARVGVVAVGPAVVLAVVAVAVGVVVVVPGAVLVHAVVPGLGRPGVHVGVGVVAVVAAVVLAVVAIAVGVVVARPVAVLVDAVVPGLGRPGVHVGVGVVAVAAAQRAVGPALRRPAVAVGVVIVGGIAVLVDPVVPGLGGPGVHVGVGVVAVLPAGRLGGVAVGVGIVVVIPGAVGIHPVVPGLDRARVHARIGVVAVVAPVGIGVVAVGVGVVVAVPGAVGIHPVVPGLEGAGVDAGVVVVAVALGLGAPVAVRVVEAQRREHHVVEAPGVGGVVVGERDRVGRVVEAQAEEDPAGRVLARKVHRLRVEGGAAVLDGQREGAGPVEQVEGDGVLLLVEADRGAGPAGEGGLGVAGSRAVHVGGHGERAVEGQAEVGGVVVVDDLAEGEVLEVGDLGRIAGGGGPGRGVGLHRHRAGVHHAVAVVVDAVAEHLGGVRGDRGVLVVAVPHVLAPAVAVAVGGAGPEHLHRVEAPLVAGGGLEGELGDRLGEAHADEAALADVGGVQLEEPAREERREAAVEAHLEAALAVEDPQGQGVHLVGKGQGDAVGGAGHHLDAGVADRRGVPHARLGGGAAAGRDREPVRRVDAADVAAGGEALEAEGIRQVGGVGSPRRSEQVVEVPRPLGGVAAKDQHVVDPAVAVVVSEVAVHLGHPRVDARVLVVAVHPVHRGRHEAVAVAVGEVRLHRPDVDPARAGEAAGGGVGGRKREVGVAVAVVVAHPGEGRAEGAAGVGAVDRVVGVRGRQARAPEGGPGVDRPARGQPAPVVGGGDDEVVGAALVEVADDDGRAEVGGGGIPVGLGVRVGGGVVIATQSRRAQPGVDAAPGPGDGARVGGADDEVALPVAVEVAGGDRGAQLGVGLAAAEGGPGLARQVEGARQAAPGHGVDAPGVGGARRGVEVGRGHQQVAGPVAVEVGQGHGAAGAVVARLAQQRRVGRIEAARAPGERRGPAVEHEGGPGLVARRVVLRRADEEVAVAVPVDVAGGHRPAGPGLLVGAAARARGGRRGAEDRPVGVGGQREVAENFPAGEDVDRPGAGGGGAVLGGAEDHLVGAVAVEVGQGRRRAEPDAGGVGGKARERGIQAVAGRLLAAPEQPGGVGVLGADQQLGVAVAVHVAAGQGAPGVLGDGAAVPGDVDLLGGAGRGRRSLPLLAEPGARAVAQAPGAGPGQAGAGAAGGADHGAGAAVHARVAEGDVVERDHRLVPPLDEPGLHRAVAPGAVVGAAPLGDEDPVRVAPEDLPGRRAGGPVVPEGRHPAVGRAVRAGGRGGGPVEEQHAVVGEGELVDGDAVPLEVEAQVHVRGAVVGEPRVGRVAERQQRVGRAVGLVGIGVDVVPGVRAAGPGPQGHGDPDAEEAHPPPRALAAVLHGGSLPRRPRPRRARPGRRLRSGTCG